jgi:hypothetical protein
LARAVESTALKRLKQATPKSRAGDGVSPGHVRGTLRNSWIVSGRNVSAVGPRRVVTINFANLAPYGAYVNDGTSSPIVSSRRGGWMRYNQGGGTVFRQVVSGQDPQKFVEGWVKSMNSPAGAVNGVRVLARRTR